MKLSRSAALYIGFALVATGLFLAFGASQMADASLLPAIGAFGMTTLAANTPRAYEMGNRNDIPMIAADIIYEGAAVGIVAGSGHARPLIAADKFAGFAERTADNSAGSAAAINVRAIDSGKIQLSIASLVATSIGAAVYASDDNTFTLVSTSNTKIGTVARFVSAGVGVVDFKAFTS